jgi:hypothetical protein
MMRMLSDEWRGRNGVDEMARTKIKWVAQVSLLRHGFSRKRVLAGIPRSQKRDLGHPLFAEGLRFAQGLAEIKPY